MLSTIGPFVRRIVVAPVLLWSLTGAEAQSAPLAMPTWRLSRVLTIGDDEAGPEYEFSAILAVAVRADGHVILVQRGDHQLREYDASGTHVRSIGRTGSGPGEYRFLTTAGFLGDTLWTLDVALRRITFYGRDGKVLTSIQQTEALASSGGGPAYYFQPMALLANGGVIAFGGAETEALASGALTRTPHVRMSRSGTVTDTVAWRAVRARPMVFKSGDRTTYNIQALADEDGMAIAPTLNRVYVFGRGEETSRDRGTFTVSALTDRGRKVWQRSFSYTPKPFPGHRVDSAVEGTTATLRKTGLAVTESQVRSQLYVPRYEAPFTSGVVAQDGHLWLGRERSATGQVYWVLNPAGQQVATVTAPAGVTLRWLDGDTAWGTERGDDDIPLVVKYRVERGPQPARRP